MCKSSAALKVPELTPAPAPSIKGWLQAAPALDTKYVLLLVLFCVAEPVCFKFFSWLSKVKAAYRILLKIFILRRYRI